MMKLKKILTYKPFIIGALVVLCVSTLVISLYLNNDRSPDFIPDTTSVGNLTDSWEENKSDVQSGTPSDPAVSNTPAVSGGEAGPKANDNQYPKEVENKDSTVIVDFTDPEPEKPKAPEKPAASADTDNPAKPPEYKEDETKPPTKSTGTPAPGSKNEKGEIYDPVFGWIKVVEGVGIPTDNDGDPDKQVGSMGP